MKKKQPFFSIVIPTLNEERFLGILLSSLVHQTYQNFEVIISDGSSEDRTYDVFKRFKKKLSHLRWYTTKTRNVSFQRNRGAKYAKGRYLIFFDADVKVSKNHLNDLAYYLVKQNSVFATTWVVPENDSLIDYSWMTIWNLLVYTSRYTPRSVVSGHNIIVYKDVFYRSGGFDTQATIAEDHLLARKIQKLGYTMDVFETLEQVVSMRRINKEGRIEMGIKQSYALYHTFFKGPIYSKLFDYPMGGGHYNHEKKK